MKLRFKKTEKVKQEEGYIIPLPIIMYLNETYDDRDISYSILHYFLCYLKEECNISLLESYRLDSNEIKVELNGLSNRDIPYNETINIKLVDTFCSFIKEKEINLSTLVENIDELPEKIDSVKIYDQFCYRIIKEELQRQDDEQIIDFNIEDDEEDIKIAEKVEDVIEDLSISKLFSKYFDPKSEILEKTNKETSPEYEWSDTSLRFKKPDGTWGKWVDLKGSSGKSGGGSKGMNREQVNELIQDALALEESSTVSNVFPFFMS